MMRRCTILISFSNDWKCRKTIKKVNCHKLLKQFNTQVKQYLCQAHGGTQSLILTTQSLSLKMFARLEILSVFGCQRGRAENVFLTNGSENFVAHTQICFRKRFSWIWEMIGLCGRPASPRARSSPWIPNHTARVHPVRSQAVVQVVLPVLQAMNIKLFLWFEMDAES